MDISELIVSIPNLIGKAVEANEWVGYGAILCAMFLENLFPPIPSELIIPLGGFYVSQGQLSFLPVIFAGLIGTLLGALPWYGMGRLINEEKLEYLLRKYGKWIGIKPNELNRSRNWFNKYGKSLVFWGRLIPGIRTLISLPAGIELMPFLPFIVWTSAGSIIWILFLTYAGIILGDNYTIVEVWIEPISSIIKIILLLGLLFIFIRILMRTFTKQK